MIWLYIAGILIATVGMAIPFPKIFANVLMAGLGLGIIAAAFVVEFHEIAARKRRACPTCHGAGTVNDKEATVLSNNQRL